MANISSDQQHAAKCYLLDLPGELRNRIYNFAQEQHPVTFLCRRVGDSELAVYHKDEIDKIESDYHGLTQVCCQIRAEYSPIYASMAEVRVYHVDLNAFIAKDCPHLARDHEGKVIGHLSIIFNNGWCSHFSLLPSLNYFKSMENLRIRVKYSGEVPNDGAWKYVKGQLTALFDIARRLELQSWLRNAVYDIRYTAYSWVVYDVHEKGLECWMQTWYKEHHSNVQTQGIQAWSKLTGISIHQHMRFSFRCFNRSGLREKQEFQSD